jgi:hypothetical protein
MYDEIREVMPWQGRLSAERMRQLAGVSRAGFYRHLVEIAPHKEEMERRDTIQCRFAQHVRPPVRNLQST